MELKRSFRRAHQERMEDVSVKKTQPQDGNYVKAVKQKESGHEEHFRTVLAVAGLVTLK